MSGLTVGFIVGGSIVVNAVRGGNHKPSEADIPARGSFATLA